MLAATQTLTKSTGTVAGSAYFWGSFLRNSVTFARREAGRAQRTSSLSVQLVSCSRQEGGSARWCLGSHNAAALPTPVVGKLLRALLIPLGPRPNSGSHPCQWSSGGLKCAVMHLQFLLAALFCSFFFFYWPSATAYAWMTPQSLLRYTKLCTRPACLDLGGTQTQRGTN